LSDVALVVRGGAQREAAPLFDSLLDTPALDGEHVLSVFASERRDVEDIPDTLRRICQDARIPHTKVQMASAGTLRRAGFGLVHSVAEGEAYCHYHVVFPEPMGLECVERFIRCFDGPIENPTGGRGRRRS
jgi:hypothetical protein